MSQVMDEFGLLYLAGFSLVVPKCSDVRYLAAHCAAVHATVVVHSKKKILKAPSVRAQLVRAPL